MAGLCQSVYERNIVAPKLRVATNDDLIDYLYGALLSCFKQKPSRLGTENYATEKIEKTEPAKIEMLSKSEYETPRTTNSIYTVQMKSLAKVKMQEIPSDFVQTSQVIAACSVQVI